MLRFQQIIKSYRTAASSQQALKGVSAHIARGEVVALCGPSGSGKSTLLNICGLLDRDFQGELFLDGVKTPSSSNALTALRREKVGFIFQRYNLIPVMSAFENVEYPLLMLGLAKFERRKRVTQLLEAVGLSTYSRQRPDQLSGGQQQRVAIARALVKTPALVIADEPTANLDTQTAYQVIDLMRNLGTELGSTFVIATHDQRMTENCDRVLKLADGLLLEEEFHSSYSEENMRCAG